MRIFSAVFAELHHEDDGIFQFCKRIRIPEFMPDFLVGDRTTLEKNSNFRNFFGQFSKFEYEDDGIFSFCKRIRIPHFFLDFWVGEWTTLKKIRIF